MKQNLQKNKKIFLPTDPNFFRHVSRNTTIFFLGLEKKSNEKAMNRNWCNQKANPAFKTKTGNNQNHRQTKMANRVGSYFIKGDHSAIQTELKSIMNKQKVKHLRNSDTKNRRGGGGGGGVGGGGLNQFYGAKLTLSYCCGTNKVEYYEEAKTRT